MGFVPRKLQRARLQSDFCLHIYTHVNETSFFFEGRPMPCLRPDRVEIETRDSSCEAYGLTSENMKTLSLFEG